ncbi:hypothetical protein [Acetobacter conturbans]|uniref:DNA-binding protein n=1 Tax=Acetobacter conturbans TaxID=1737472 RepID=A0ABX0JYE5_9PROT|nr:hypothetical protein [Acetobacter conturbans]NHN87078.1 hypothetical protein [Acetobacter conturbans]
MNDVFQNTDGNSVFLFPEKSLLDRQEAARELGVSNRMMLALIVLRSAPPSLKIRSKTLWRREDISLFRQVWLATVRVADKDRTTRLAAIPTSRSPEEPDPLMRLLGLRTIRHRIVLAIFGAMVITGGLISLILY